MRTRHILIIGGVLIAGALLALLIGQEEHLPQGQAPEFSLTSIDGERITLETLEGKPAVLWFTATYCVPCQIGAREVQKVEEDFPPEAFSVVMIFIDLSETEGDLRRWQEEFAGPEWSLAFGNEEMTRAYNVRALDTQVVLDRNGTIRTTLLHPARYSEYKELMEELL